MCVCAAGGVGRVCVCVCGGRGRARVCVCVGCGGGGRVCAGGDMKLGPTDFHAYATLPDKHSKSYQKKTGPVKYTSAKILVSRKLIGVYQYFSTVKTDLRNC